MCLGITLVKMPSPDSIPIESGIIFPLSPSSSSTRRAACIAEHITMASSGGRSCALVVSKNFRNNSLYIWNSCHSPSQYNFIIILHRHLSIFQNAPANDFNLPYQVINQLLKLDAGNSNVQIKRALSGYRERRD